MGRDKCVHYCMSVLVPVFYARLNLSNRGDILLLMRVLALRSSWLGAGASRLSAWNRKARRKESQMAISQIAISQMDKWVSIADPSFLLIRSLWFPWKFSKGLFTTLQASQSKGRLLAWPVDVATDLLWVGHKNFA